MFDSKAIPSISSPPRRLNAIPSKTSGGVQETRRQAGLLLLAGAGLDRPWWRCGSSSWPRSGDRPLDKAQDGSFDDYLRTKSIPQIKSFWTTTKEYPVVVCSDTPTKAMTPSGLLRSSSCSTSTQLIWNNRLGGTYKVTPKPPSSSSRTGLPWPRLGVLHDHDDTWGFKSYRY